jgi:hypothetical protein
MVTQARRLDELHESVSVVEASRRHKHWVPLYWMPRICDDRHAVSCPIGPPVSIRVCDLRVALSRHVCRV